MMCSSGFSDAGSDRNTIPPPLTWPEKMHSFSSLSVRFHGVGGAVPELRTLR